MGAFFTNYQVRSDSATTVRDALNGLIRSRAYVSSSKNGWVTVYDEESDTQDDRVLGRIAAGLSHKLNTAVLAFLVHDSDIAAYWLYRGGELLDEFNSAPDYFKKASAATHARLRGKVEVLLPLCVPGTTPQQLEAVIHAPEGSPVMAEDILVDLAPLLGIDESRITVGFTYFDEEGAELLPDVAEFEPAGRGAERKEASASAEAGLQAQQVDAFALAVSMMTQQWGARRPWEKALGMVPDIGAFKAMRQQFLDGFDQGARRMLKHSRMPDCPSFEAVRAAREQGPEALAKLLAERAPASLPDIAVAAATIEAEAFIAALLQHGLDPKAPNSQGVSPRQAAERLGPKSKTYQLLNIAS